MPINPLNHHYAIENPASVYDEEAMTALELAGRTTAKVNEVVQSQNETVAHVAEQDADIEHQKNVVIPQKIKTEVQRHIDNGDFDRQIDKYAGELRSELSTGLTEAETSFTSRITQEVNPLEARVDTLLGSLQTGSTSGDAELIDLRTNPDGTTSASAGDALRNHYPYMVPQTVESANYKTLLPTMNIWKPSVYRLVFGTGDTEVTADSPFTTWPGGIVTLITTNDHQAWGQNMYTTQLLISDVGIFYRWSTGNYNQWKNITEMSNAITSPMYEVDYSNWETVCPNIDDIEGATVLRFLFGGGSTKFPAGFPFTSWPSRYTMVTLITTSGHYATGQLYRTQLLITCDNIYYRYAGTTWEKWFCLTAKNEKAHLTVTSGGSLLEGVKACYEQGFKKLIVQPGTYDLIAEYKAHYGNQYFEQYVNYSTDDPFDRGLWLEDIEVVFSPGAHVICKYDGSNGNVKAYFSAIATGNDVVIDGLELDAENLRYGIHPDYAHGEGRATMVIRNSILSHKRGTNNCKAIGAGFGSHNDWLIENCIFKSNDITESVFSCHNSNWTDTVQSRLTVRNCYIEGPGWFKFTHYGDSPYKTPVIVTGCSYVNEPVVGYENDTYHVENIALYAFGNEKRSW